MAWELLPLVLLRTPDGGAAFLTPCASKAFCKRPTTSTFCALPDDLLPEAEDEEVGEESFIGVEVVVWVDMLFRFTSFLATRSRSSDSNTQRPYTRFPSG